MHTSNEGHVPTWCTIIVWVLCLPCGLAYAGKVYVYIKVVHLSYDSMFNIPGKPSITQELHNNVYIAYIPTYVVDVNTNQISTRVNLSRSAGCNIPKTLC